MSKIKRFISIILFSIIFVSLVGCNKNDYVPTDEELNKVVEKLTILSVNDFHGALEKDSDGRFGAARLAYLIEQEKKHSQASVLISAGDMFQGTALSSYNKGKTVIDVMNVMEFDAMSLGNHEFDWGYDEIYKYVDGEISNGEANFPYLGCNIIEKSTGQLAKGLKPYQVINKGGLIIGIIGFIGDTVENSISPQFIEPFEFTTVLTSVKKYTKELRTIHKADVVIAVGHQDERYNESIANLFGDEKVDAIINGHSHQAYTDIITRSDGTTVPCIQSGSAGEQYGCITLGIDTSTKEVKGGTAQNKRSNGKDINSYVDKIISDLSVETAPVFSRVIGVATENVYKTSCELWAATALRNYTETDLAVINAGGIRNQGLPIYKGSNILVSTVHGFMPFDNIIKIVTLTGQEVKKLYKSWVYSSNVTFDNSGNMYINNKLINDYQKYTVASIDYIFDNEKYPFLRGENILNTGILFRDVLIETIEQDGSIIIPL